MSLHLQMMLERVEFSEGSPALLCLLLKRHPLLCLCDVFVGVWQSGILLFVPSYCCWLQDRWRPAYIYFSFLNFGLLIAEKEFQGCFLPQRLIISSIM